MSKFNVQKVESLPSPLVANTIYYVKGAIENDPVNVYVTNSGGTLVAVPAGWKIMTNQPFSNINNFTDYETYYRGGFQSSGWPGDSSYMNIFSLKFQNPVAVTQLGFSQGNKAFMRYGESGSFGAWQEFWHTGNLDPVVLRTAGNTGVGAVKYNGTTKAEGQFYGGSGSIPISNQRLNYDGDLYATSFICRTGQYIGNGDSDTASHYFKPIVDGVIYNVSSGKEHIFRVNNSNVAKLTNEGVISLSGIKTGDPEGTSSAFWRLGRVFDTTPTADKGIRVQIENKYYDILAEYIGEIVV